MCRHCEKLTEDKQIVHDFMAVGAKRLSEIHGREISPDDLDVAITLTVAVTNDNPYGLRGYQLLDEITKESATLF